MFSDSKKHLLPGLCRLEKLSHLLILAYSPCWCSLQLVHFHILAPSSQIHVPVLLPSLTLLIYTICSFTVSFTLNNRFLFCSLRRLNFVTLTGPVCDTLCVCFHSDGKYAFSVSQRGNYPCITEHADWHSFSSMPDN